MQCIIGKIDKKINSTKHTFETGTTTTYNVVWKDEVSRETPILIVTGSPDSKANYMSFNGLYYWIDDIVSVTSNSFELHAHIDPLASYKDYITDVNKKFFVNYASERTLWNKYVDDPRLQPNVQAPMKDFDTQFGGSTWSIITLVSSSPINSSGDACGCFWLVSDWNSYASMLKGYYTALYADASSVSDLMDKMYLKWSGQDAATNAIIGVWAIPLPLSASGSGAAAAMNFFDSPMDSTLYGINIMGYPLSQGFYLSSTGSRAMTIALLPETTLQNTIFDDHCNTYPFLKLPKYTQIKCSTPGGISDLSNSAWVGDGNNVAPVCKYGASIDIYGNVQMVFRLADSSSQSSKNDILNVNGWNTSFDLSYNAHQAKNASNMNFASNLVKTGLSAGVMAVSMAAGVGVADDVSSAHIASVKASKVLNKKTKKQLIGALKDAQREANAAASEEEASFKQMNDIIDSGVSGIMQAPPVAHGSITGNFSYGDNGLAVNGARTSAFKCLFQSRTYLPQMIADGTYEDYCEEYGFPVFKYTSLATFTGYVQTAGASVSIPASPNIISSVNSLLNHGIWLE